MILYDMLSSHRDRSSLTMASISSSSSPSASSSSSSSSSDSSSSSSDSLSSCESTSSKCHPPPIIALSKRPRDLTPSPIPSSPSLAPMTDSTDLYRSGQFGSVQQRLDVDGFILVRGVIPADVVDEARAAVIGQLQREGAVMEDEAVIKVLMALYKVPTKKKKPNVPEPPATQSPPGWVVDAMTGDVVGRPPSPNSTSSAPPWLSIGTSPALTSIYAGRHLHSFCSNIFHRPSSSLSQPSTASPLSYRLLSDRTYIRAKGPGEITVDHADLYYYKDKTSVLIDEKDRSPMILHPSLTLPVDCANFPYSPLLVPLATSATASASLVHGESDGVRLLSVRTCCGCRHDFHVAGPRPLQWYCKYCINAPPPYYTCWISLGDIVESESRLKVIPSSHHLLGFGTPCEKTTDNTGLLPSGFTKEFRRNAVWQSPAVVGKGDVIMFNWKTIHAATRHEGADKYRLSIDTRVYATMTAEETMAATPAKSRMQHAWMSSRGGNVKGSEAFEDSVYAPYCIDHAESRFFWSRYHTHLLYHWLRLHSPTSVEVIQLRIDQRELILDLLAIVDPRSPLYVRRPISPGDDIIILRFLQREWKKHHSQTQLIPQRHLEYVIDKSEFDTITASLA